MRTPKKCSSVGSSKCRARQMTAKKIWIQIIPNRIKILNVYSKKSARWCDKFQQPLAICHCWIAFVHLIFWFIRTRAASYPRNGMKRMQCQYKIHKQLNYAHFPLAYIKLIRLSIISWPHKPNGSTAQYPSCIGLRNFTQLVRIAFNFLIYYFVFIECIINTIIAHIFLYSNCLPYYSLAISCYSGWIS